MKIKICGLKYEDNLNAIKAFKPDFVGFVFYEKSKRFVGLENEVLAFYSNEINKVGVFVNQSIEIVEHIANKYSFKYLQLHGDETPNYCEELKNKGFTIIKAFGVDDEFDFSTLSEYDLKVDYFLFDTKTKDYGGSGKVFDWNILDKYHLTTPFFLSGGIGVENIDDILKISHSLLFAIDVNSKFEIEPGLKDLDKSRQVINKLKSKEFN